MQKIDQANIIEEAINVVDQMNPQSSGGVWLEDLTVAVSPHIKDWDIAQCWPWGDWPDRQLHYRSSTVQDVGIDLVAVRRSDGEYIAIQCKSRQLDENGRGSPIPKADIDKFISTSSTPFWAERWVVTNGDNPLSGNVEKAIPSGLAPIKVVNITTDLLQQQATFSHVECPHSQPNPDGEERQQTRLCMQEEAIAESVRILKEHKQSESGGLPIGQARGKIILPCGTGKTRISLRIVEELTPTGKLSIVLCPSIALVAQIRREYLQHAESDIRVLAVCSDETAGYDPKKEGQRNASKDPTVDNSNVSANEVKGEVTTNPAKITEWIRHESGRRPINVILGTYQSGHRIAEALRVTGATACVLIADEAHRTAGLKRKQTKKARLSDEEGRIRNFTLCHDQEEFPATYRVYQTATPRIYNTSKVDHNETGDWIVRTMDDETVFGVELYRKSYVEAVRNGWLSDYRIIALGVNDPDAFAQANAMAEKNRCKGRRALTTKDYLRGLAFALSMGGATQDRESGIVPINSCIAFMNTVDKSKNMAEDLQTENVKQWVQKWLWDNVGNCGVKDFTMEHLDASSKVTARDNAKRRLAEATEEHPHSVINVGIFGEGTDSPSLNAVAFLEARKSPIDVIQAVGRAMRTAPDKKIGYIICPILIPPNADPEKWLSSSGPEDGWQELGEILTALRSHDQRIEDNLAELLQLYIPKPPEVEVTIVAVASGENKRISYREHEGAPGEAQKAIERVLDDKSTLTAEFQHIADRESFWTKEPTDKSADGQTGFTVERKPSNAMERPEAEPTQIITGKKNDDGSVEIRLDAVARTQPKRDGSQGDVDIKKSKAKAKDMINKGTGLRLPHNSERNAQHPTRAERNAMQMLLLSGMEDYGNAIKMNLLAKSGLVDNRVVRDLNILESSIREAAHHLQSDDLQPALDRHFGLNNLDEAKRQSQADGCTIAALLLMNAAMLHQRIVNGRWLTGVSDLSTIKNDVNVVRNVSREWERIMRRDFRPILEPALETIYVMEETGRIAGLERSLRHIAAEAERIAETYADMGADHAGPLFNRVMGNQDSDGAFFTRPVAASITARLTLDACGEQDWTNPAVWREHKTVDLACGSGTLLAAILTDMKRRAGEQKAGETQIADLQKLAVEEVIKGLDINPISLQLAASQLTAGNQEIRYRNMGLHLMPYGPQRDDPTRISAGTLELLGQRSIVGRKGELDLPDAPLSSQNLWNPQRDAELEDAVDAVQDARIVIMNPPFTSRRKMGEKFPKGTQVALRSKTDSLEKTLLETDPDLKGFADKNSIRPLFVALAEHLQKRPGGVVSMINPTIALSAISGLKERQILSERFHIQTVLTCHQPGNINLSQKTNINESLVVMRRHGASPKPPTRFIHLDRMPVEESEVQDFHQFLSESDKGIIANGWGEVSEWPAERMEKGDWTPAIWRSPELAEAAYQFATHHDMRPIRDHLYSCGATLQMMDKKNFVPANSSKQGSFFIIDSKGADGQQRIQSTPDAEWEPKNPNKEQRVLNDGMDPQVQRLLQKAGFLLITSGQRTSTARLTAIADDIKYVGRGWLPVTGPNAPEAKAISVFLNSTAGRLQLLRNAGRTLDFPQYNPEPLEGIRIPNIKDTRIRQILADCWERTRDMQVPQFRDGECEVRCLWDEAVAEAMDWDDRYLVHLRHLLHKEPHVRGLGYGQYGDELEEIDVVDD